MAGDQQNVLYTRDRTEYRLGIARQGAQAHADVANLGLGQTRCDAQRFAEDFLDASRGGVRVKAGASFPGGPNRDPTVRPGDHIVAAEGTHHGPCAGVSPRQAEMDNLPTLWCHRDLDAQLRPKGLRPGTASNHDCPGLESRASHNDASNSTVLNNQPLDTALLKAQPALLRCLPQGPVEQTPIHSRSIAVVQCAVDRRQRRRGGKASQHTILHTENFGPAACS